MSENEDLFNQLEKTIDQLIEISEFLSHSFSRIFTRDELKVLKERQLAMQKQMDSVKKTCDEYTEGFSAEGIARLDFKITRFQKLNKELLDKFNQGDLR